MVPLLADAANSFLSHAQTRRFFGARPPCRFFFLPVEMRSFAFVALRHGTTF